ncbi:hypothetical protein BDZ89DRAFT_1047726 [Hymenopellis radicata]|nr:hypothetical protein BDZ89DRAFT_1047726 [Hymenopellis radicata]
MMGGEMYAGSPGKKMNEGRINESTIRTDDWSPRTLADLQTRLEDAPIWLRQAVDEFAGATGGTDLIPVLGLLVEIERAYGFISVQEGRKHGLRAKGRPTLLSAWIQNGRTRNGKRSILMPGDAEGFAKEWHAWWGALQPKWRRAGKDGKWTRGEWARRDGSFWFNPSYCLAEGKAESEWREQEMDVRWMMVGLKVEVRKDPRWKVNFA